MATNVVGLTGPAGAGKSEAARYLTEGHGFALRKFAGPLKAMLRAYFEAVGLTPEEIERRIEGDLKEVPCRYLGGHTPRYAMQTLGTEWGRACMGEDFWVNAWVSSVENTKGNVVTDDCRFDNEAEAIHELGGVVLKLIPSERRRATSNHPSEDGVCPELVDHSITNDGTISDLRVKVTEALRPGYVHTFTPLF